MYGVRQKLHTRLKSSDLDVMLSEGARVVYLKRHASGEWDAVLETEDEVVDPRAVVLDFLVNVDPGQLEKFMLENHSLDESMGKAAIKALTEMVVPRASA